jgi:site-specific recombinase XerD
MTLADVVATYVAFKRALGMRFVSDAFRLQAFCRAMGEIEVAAVTPTATRAFLAGPGPVTPYWHLKYRILRSFYRYAIGRGFVATSPLPPTVPICPPPLTPYIYSTAELQRLLAATAALRTPRDPARALVFRTLLLLLYGTGMRIGEALALTCADVDLDQALVTIRQAKFFKTRLVPIGPTLTRELATYLHQCRPRARPAGAAAAFFVTRAGRPLRYDSVCRGFGRLRQLAGVRRERTARYQPRIHDVRHTMAVHRLIAWYRAGVDVQHRLPQLATYLGHVDLSATQRYLTMTPDLLHEASRRFARYADEEGRHAH